MERIFWRCNYPAGIYISYKYSLGDGFWNAEHGLLGEFRIRELIVPEEDATFYESIDSWEASGAKPVHFYLTVPQNTPVSEHVSIQLNPFGWMEPLTAWPMGDNKWEYTLYSPMNLVGEVAFRICRNEQCDYALDLAAVTSTDANNVFTPSLIEQDIYYEVEEWAYLKSPDEPTPVVTTTITKKSDGFITGVELTRFTNPSWMSSYPSTLQNISDLGANWVIISPTWTVINNSPPVIIQKPGTDLLQPDTSVQISEAAGRGLKVAVYPRLNFPNGVSSWWSNGTCDQDWWQTWFDRYSAFILHHASLAEKNGASALILGGTEIIPALPLGKLFDGAESGVPLDAEARWLALLGEVHSRFSGSVGWVVPYPYLFDRTPSFVNQVDWLYLLWAAPITASDNPVQAEMTVEITRLLEQDIKILKEDTGKPVVLGLQIAAANGSASNCISASEGCLQVNWEKTSVYTDPACPIDLLEQVEIYNAFFIALNQISWLDGIVSRGYYPPANLQDCSPSIHGKPAADVLWYWYPRLIGVK